MKKEGGGSRRRKMIINIEKYDKIMDELQVLWVENEGLLKKNSRRDGIRSSQIAALVALLVDKGIFDKGELETEKECNCHRHKSGYSTGGWYCPIHGHVF